MWLRARVSSALKKEPKKKKTKEVLIENFEVLPKTQIFFPVDGDFFDRTLETFALTCALNA